MNKQLLSAAGSLAALVCASLAQQAAAQTGPTDPAQGATDQGLGDIVVTARRVSENLQKVPVAVTAYSGEALKQQNVRSLPEVALLTPGLKFSPAQINNSAVLIQMRGQVQTDVSGTIDPSVGTYVDGVYWGRAYGMNASLVDVRSFQALKGPQGTLFGRNTSGGDILIETNDPSFSEGLSGSLSGTYGNYNYQALTAVLNAPLVDDKLGVRLVYSGNKRDGYVRDTISGREMGDMNDYLLRGKILVQPTESFRVLLSGEKFHSKDHPEPGVLGYFVPFGRPSLEAGLEQLGPAACTAALPACVAAGNAYLANLVATNPASGRNRAVSQVNEITTNTETYSATATYDTSFGAIKAVGAFRQVHSDNINADQDGFAVRVLDSLVSDLKIKQWSGEVTATGSAFNDLLDFAAGGFFFRETGYDHGASSTFTLLGQFLSPPFGTRKTTIYNGEIKNIGRGIYGQVTAHATEKLSITGGLRYSSDTKSISSVNGTGIGSIDTTAPTFICQLSTCPLDRSATFKSVSYTVSVDYKVKDDIMVYAKTAKGYRSGGQNLRGISAVPPSLNSFKPEQAYSYEAGLKSEFLDRRLRVNLAGYYTLVKDVQRNSTVVVGNTTSGVISNAASLEIYGVEADVSALLPGGFRLDGTAAYTDPKYKNFIDFNGFDRGREAIAYVPKWTVTISPSWSGEFGSAKLYVRGDFAYQSQNYVFPVGYYKDATGAFVDAASGGKRTSVGPITQADVDGFLASANNKAHWLINARTGVTLLDGQLDIAVWGKNLGNSRDIVNALVITGLEATRSIPREPRTFGATVGVKF